MTFEFWQRSLLGLSIGFAIFGGVTAVLPFAPWFELRNVAIAEVFFDGTWTSSAMAYHRFSAGPLGGTIAGFYVLQAFIIAVPFRKRERWAWHATLWGTLVWFVIDSAVSLAHGAAFNIYLVNVVPLVLFVIPLGATWHAVGANPH